MSEKFEEGSQIVSVSIGAGWWREAPVLERGNNVGLISPQSSLWFFYPVTGRGPESDPHGVYRREEIELSADIWPADGNDWNDVAFRLYRKAELQNWPDGDPRPAGFGDSAKDPAFEDYDGTVSVRAKIDLYAGEEFYLQLVNGTEKRLNFNLRLSVRPHG